MRQEKEPEYCEYIGSLLCPGCGHNYTHQGAVEVFSCKEDCQATQIVVNDLKVAIDIKPARDRNPSPRRHGVIIHLNCEECEAGGELLIYQHKGNTYIKVRESEPPPVVYPVRRPADALEKILNDLERGK